MQKVPELLRLTEHLQIKWNIAIGSKCVLQVKPAHGHFWCFFMAIFSHIWLLKGMLCRICRPLTVNNLAILEKDGWFLSLIQQRFGLQSLVFDDPGMRLNNQPCSYIPSTAIY